MPETDTPQTPQTQPRLTRELFHHFSMGYHLCIDDGDLFTELTTHETYYRWLFDTLGFHLCDGASGIYYFEPDRDKLGINRVSKKFTVFMAILYDFLADQGQDPVCAIIEQRFVVPELPHLRMDPYRKILEQVGINGDADLLRTVQQLHRYGFLELKDNYLIMFKRSVSRFTTLFAEVIEPSETVPEQGDEWDDA